MADSQDSAIFLGDFGHCGSADRASGQSAGDVPDAASESCDDWTLTFDLPMSVDWLPNCRSNGNSRGRVWHEPFWRNIRIRTCESEARQRTDEEDEFSHSRSWATGPNVI